MITLKMELTESEKMAENEKKKEFSLLLSTTNPAWHFDYETWLLSCFNL